MEKHKIELTESEILVDGHVLAMNDIQDGVMWFKNRDINSSQVVMSDRSGIIILVCFGMIEEQAEMKNQHWWMCYKCNKLTEIISSSDKCSDCND